MFWGACHDAWNMSKGCWAGPKKQVVRPWLDFYQIDSETTPPHEEHHSRMDLLMCGQVDWVRPVKRADWFGLSLKKYIASLATALLEGFRVGWVSKVFQLSNHCSNPNSVCLYKQSSQTAAILGGLMPIEHEGMLMGIMSDRFIAAFKGSSE